MPTSPGVTLAMVLFSELCRSFNVTALPLLNFCTTIQRDKCSLHCILYGDTCWLLKVSLLSLPKGKPQQHSGDNSDLHQWYPKFTLFCVIKSGLGSGLWFGMHSHHNPTPFQDLFHPPCPIYSLFCTTLLFCTPPSPHWTHSIGLSLVGFPLTT